MLRFAFFGLMLGFLSLPGRAQTPDLAIVTHEQLRQAITDSDAEVKIVNFWATWCGPCREEFPDFIKLGKDFENKGVTVFFVSMDFDDEQPAVLAFLAEQGWTQRSYLRTGNDDEFISALHDDWSGVLPATFIYGPDDDLHDFWQGKPVGYDMLATRVNAVLEN